MTGRMVHKRSSHAKCPSSARGANRGARGVYEASRSVLAKECGEQFSELALVGGGPACRRGSGRRTRHHDGLHAQFGEHVKRHERPRALVAGLILRLHNLSTWVAIQLLTNLIDRLGVVLLDAHDRSRPCFLRLTFLDQVVVETA